MRKFTPAMTPYTRQLMVNRNLEIIELRKQGLTQQEIADQVGLNQSQISRILNEPRLTSDEAGIMHNGYIEEVARGKKM